MPLSVIVPLVIGVVFGVIFPYKVLVDMSNAIKRSRGDRHYSFLFIFVFALVFFQLLLILSLGVCTAIASIVSVVLVALFCPVMLLLIPYYMLRITLLSCRTLK